jgi:Flp pilus assembly pilin Flp
MHRLLPFVLPRGDDERGANLVEYVLLLMFIAILVLAVIVAFGGEVSEKYSGASSALLNAGS